MRIQASEPALDIACCTDPGPARDHNEDACALPPPWADPDRLGTLLVVADGVGGLPGGAEASRNAVGYLQALYYAPPGPETPAERLHETVQAVNTLNRRSPGRDTDRGQLTTLVAAVIRGDDLWIANVGDSRAYLCRIEQQPPRQLTQDHAGSQGHAITHAIGLDDECQVDLYRYAWEPGDALVLCSDGLAALPGPQFATLALSLPAEEAASALVRHAITLDGSDNATAVVARRNGGDARKRPTAPAHTPRRGARATRPARQEADDPASRPRSRLGLGLFLGLILGWLTAALLIYAAVTGGYVSNF